MTASPFCGLFSNSLRNYWPYPTKYTKRLVQFCLELNTLFNATMMKMVLKLLLQHPLPMEHFQIQGKSTNLSSKLPKIDFNSMNNFIHFFMIKRKNTDIRTDRQTFCICKFFGISDQLTCKSIKTLKSKKILITIISILKTKKQK